ISTTTPHTQITTLSLHDALPISPAPGDPRGAQHPHPAGVRGGGPGTPRLNRDPAATSERGRPGGGAGRSAQGALRSPSKASRTTASATSRSLEPRPSGRYHSTIELIMPNTSRVTSRQNG